MDLGRLFGRAEVKFTHHPKAATFQLDGQPISLVDICKEATPPCQLNPLLFCGHLQTAWTVISDPSLPVYYKRWNFLSEEKAFPGTFAVDFVIPPPAKIEVDDSLPPRTSYYSEEQFYGLNSNDAEPMLVALHGLSGGSYEIYLRSVLMPLIDSGWHACVVNSRGCANSPVTGRVLYNARTTYDIRQFVKFARKTWPRRKLFAIGFSLGANILANYLAEEGRSCVLSAAVLCSNPWNLDVSSISLQRSWTGRLYSRIMCTSMLRLFEKHLKQISQNPGVNIRRVRECSYLHEFDRELQCPIWGYPTEGAYYRDASSCDMLYAIRTPLLAINARDDPIAHKDALPLREFQKNPYAVLLETSLGGHLGWFELGGSRWFSKPIARFLEIMATVDHLQQANGDIREDSASVGSPEVDTPEFLPTRRKLRISSD